VNASHSNGARGVLRLVLATANHDKAAEIISIVTGSADGRVELLPRPVSVPEVEETGETLEENARLKACAVRDATSMPSIADDTGLEVDALGGAPGVWSSRYSGPRATYHENVSKLLVELERAGADDASRRTARFRTVAVAAFPDGHEIVADGVVEGTIALEARGSNGFGYDPVFVPSGHELTFAEMDGDEKHSMSHRGRAFRALAVGLLAEMKP